MALPAARGCLRCGVHRRGHEPSLCVHVYFLYSLPISSSACQFSVCLKHLASRLATITSPGEIFSIRRRMYCTPGVVHTREGPCPGPARQTASWKSKSGETDLLCDSPHRSRAASIKTTWGRPGRTELRAAGRVFFIMAISTQYPQSSRPFPRPGAATVCLRPVSACARVCVRREGLNG